MLMAFPTRGQLHRHDIHRSVAYTRLRHHPVRELPNRWSRAF